MNFAKFLKIPFYRIPPATASVDCFLLHGGSTTETDIGSGSLASKTATIKNTSLYYNNIFMAESILCLKNNIFL